MPLFIIQRVNGGLGFLGVNGGVVRTGTDRGALAMFQGFQGPAKWRIMLICLEDHVKRGEKGNSVVLDG